MNSLALACQEAIAAEVDAAIENPQDRSEVTIEILRQLLEAEKKARCPNPIEWVGVFDLPPTLNQQLRGGSYARAGKKKSWTSIARKESIKQGCPRFREKVWVQCTFLIKRDKDEDGLIASLKPLLDGLTPLRDSGNRIIQGSGLIVDDSPKWLKLEEAIIQKASAGAKEQVVVRIRNWG